MAVRLRFSLRGPRHNRIFHLVAVEQHARRDAKPIETLAIFDPQLQNGELHKTVRWVPERIRHWLRMGAQPSESVVKLLTLVRRTLPFLPFRSLTLWTGWYPFTQLEVPQPARGQEGLSDCGLCNSVVSPAPRGYPLNHEQPSEEAEVLLQAGGGGLAGRGNAGLGIHEHVVRYLYTVYIHCRIQSWTVEL